MVSLIIENYKCFSRQKIEFNEVTVLAGGNSVGKSSVIQALLLSRICLEKIRSTIAKGTVMPIGNDVKIPLNGVFSMSMGNSVEVLNRDAEDEFIKFNFVKSNDEAGGVSFIAPQKEDAGYSLRFNGFTGSTQIWDSISLGKDQFYYLNAERIGPRLRYEVEDTDYIHAGWNGELAIQVLGQYSLTTIPENRCYDEKEPNQLLTQARLWLDFIIPGTRLDDARIYREIKTAEITLGNSRPTNVGFGLSYVLPILINGLIAQNNCLFIVENPEAHLHPMGQSNIGKFLAKIANAGVQVIIETHSEHVINGIRLAALEGKIRHNRVHVNFFDREEKLVRVMPIKLNEKADLSDWPIGFFDQQERDLASIFRMKRQLKL